MDLSEARKRLDKIDSGMLELFEHRMEVIAHIADYKEANNLPVRDKAREQQIIDSVADKVDEDIAAYAQQFIASIIEISCEYQTKRRENIDTNR